MTEPSSPRPGPLAGRAPGPLDDGAADPAPGTAADAAVWDRLLAGRVPPPAGDGAELAERYGPLVAHRGPLVIAQLGQSLDGFIASRTGHAEFVTGPADREHLHRLRALVDAVLVGVGTVAADDCRLTVRAVPGPHPTRVVLDPSARAPAGSFVLTDDTAPTLWVVGEDAVVPGATAPHVIVVRVPAPAGTVAPADVLAALAAHGLERVLVEGGGRTVSRFLEAGTLHRLYLTTAPMLIGDGVPGIRFRGADHLSQALRAPARRFELGDDLCTELTFRS
ncbi:RibD family protein [Kocuria sp. M1R5S2]|uniref:RibD family protein n=1 Tax=Kocuria rhizosphaerae TaxID=3376285 RepID=UPI0037AAF3C3